jgi:hypothetical protein
MTYFSHLVEVYDAIHAELPRRTASRVPGLIVHLCRPSDGGFQVVEIWASQADYQRTGSASHAQLTANGPDQITTAQIEEILLRGLVIPAATSSPDPKHIEPTRLNDRARARFVEDAPPCPARQPQCERGDLRLGMNVRGP